MKYIRKTVNHSKRPPKFWRESGGREFIPLSVKYQTISRSQEKRLLYNSEKRYHCRIRKLQLIERTYGFVGSHQTRIVENISPESGKENGKQKTGRLVGTLSYSYSREAEYLLVHDVEKEKNTTWKESISTLETYQGELYKPYKPTGTSQERSSGGSQV